MESEKNEEKDPNKEAAPTLQTKDENITKINNSIKGNNDIKEFDLLFLIDATGSMGDYIRAAKEESENISSQLRTLYPEYNFQYGYIFYRDPIDSKSDIHEIINLTDNVNSLPEKISKIKAEGGGDLPEDWVGAFKLANESINWRKGIKTIMHLADAGAHGKEFTLSDKYPEESSKLKNELMKCAKSNIKIFGYIITEDARSSFNKCQELYKSYGGNYEICEFPKKKNRAHKSYDKRKKYRKKMDDSHSDSDDDKDELEDYSYEERDCCDEDMDYDIDEFREEKEDEDEDEDNGLNLEFRTKVIDNVGAILHD